jgi:hypothetical protein
LNVCTPNAQASSAASATTSTSPAVGSGTGSRKWKTGVGTSRQAWPFHRIAAGWDICRPPGVSRRPTAHMSSAARALIARATAGIRTVRQRVPAHYREGMEDQLGALGLALNSVVLFNSLYIDVAVKQLAADGFPVTDELLARLSPLRCESYVTRTRTKMMTTAGRSERQESTGR